jgi:hypothetical protein
MFLFWAIGFVMVLKIYRACNAVEAISRNLKILVGDIKRLADKDNDQS